MVALTSHPFALFLVGQPFMGGRTAGTLTLQSIQDGFGASRVPHLLLAYTPPPDAIAEFRLVDLSAWVETTRSVPRRCGHVDTEDAQPDGLIANRHNSGHWPWVLQREDIEAIERDRSEAASIHLTFLLRLRGTARLDHEMWGFKGSTMFQIPAAEWVTLLERMGYTTPPSLAGLAGPALTGDPSWSEAENRLSGARRFLRLGEGAEALEEAYHQLEVVAPYPQKAARWSAVLPTMSPEKTGAIRGMLSSVASYLSRLSRHPAEGTVGSDHARLPVDHWEAELGVGIAQLSLTYALRLRAILGRQATITSTAEVQLPVADIGDEHEPEAAEK